MSHKHKHRANEEKLSSRVNVFDRLGESKKDKSNWELNMSGKNSKNQRSNFDHYKASQNSRVSEQWSSNRDHRIHSSAKVVKSKRPDYIDNYKQDRRRYDEDIQTMKRVKSFEKIPTKRLSPTVNSSEHYERRKKKLHTPELSPVSSISSVHKKHEMKRSKYQSPPSPFYPAEREQKRGRSKERKGKKMKELMSDPVKPMKSSKASYDLYDDSASYKSHVADQPYKKIRNIDPYEQPKYHKEPSVEQYKQKKRPNDAVVTPTKRPRDAVHRESFDDNNQRYPRDSPRDVRSRSNSYKEKLVYNSNEMGDLSRKKRKSDMDQFNYDKQQQPRKGKTQTGRDEYGSQYSGRSLQLDLPRDRNMPRGRDALRDDRDVSRDMDVSRDRPKKSGQYADDRSPRPSPAPVHVKAKENKVKQSSKIVVSDQEARVKVKKKKQVPAEVTPVQKKTKNKHKVEEVPRPKKKPGIAREKTVEKTNKTIKQKRKRHDSSSSSYSSSSSTSSSSSSSDSISEGEIRSKKNSHSGRGSWDSPYVVDASPDRSYKKRPPYVRDEVGASPIEKQPRPKRPKLELARRETPESASSRTGSRYQVSPVRQSYKYPVRSGDRDPRPTYDSRKEKRIEEVPPRNERLDYSSESQKRTERHMEYSDPKHDRNIGKYTPSPIDNQYKARGPDKKGYYDNKTFPKYKDKQAEPVYNEKRNYVRREPEFQEKKIRYESRPNAYPADDRKQRPYPNRQDARLPPARPNNPDRHAPGPKQGVMKERPTGWQQDRVKKPKDPGSGYSSGVQRIWTDGRDGSKARVDTRGPQQYRDNRDPQSNRGDNYRQGRSDQRDPPRPIVRDHHPARPITRKPDHEKWGAERAPYDDNRGRRFNDDRARSPESNRIQEERPSPAFYREVRRSGEARSRDLGGIEITIRDDRGRGGGDLDKSRNSKLSPLRKVSSYEVLRARDRNADKLPEERTPVYSKDPRYKRALSPPRDKVPVSKYQQHGGRELPPLDYREDREYSKRRENEKNVDVIRSRKKEDKYYKGDPLRPLPDGDRSRPSSVVDRVRSRDSSVAGRARSRDSSRDRPPRDESRSRKDPKSSEKRVKSSKTRVQEKGGRGDSSKDRTESRKKSSKSKLPDKSSKRPPKKDDKDKKATEAADVLDVDWTGVSSSDKKTATNAPGSVLSRFTPGSVLARMGVSTKLLPPEVIDQVRKTCEQEDSSESSSLVLSHGLGALNCAESLRRLSWSGGFKSESCRMTSFDDMRYRQKILGVDEDLKYPYQPPVIINAHTYASSIRHYLAKTKLAVGG